MDEPPTVTDAIEALRREGYLADASFVDGRVRCGSCGATHAPEELTVRVVHRFEGASDPEDEAIVFGVTCGACATGAVIVSAYGPDADPAIAQMLRGR